MTSEHNEQLGKIRLEVQELEKEWHNELRMIKENHLAHMQDSLGNMRVDMATVSKDVAWLVKFFWVIATASVGGLVTSVINLI